MSVITEKSLIDSGNKTVSPLSRIRLAVVSGFGIGWLPASGTVMSALYAVMLWKHPGFITKLYSVDGISTVLPIVIAGIVLMALLIGTVEDEFRKRVTIDHILGMTLAFAFVPISPKMIIMAFALYRFFDIIKPWPIHFLNDMKQSIGTVLDDIVSGLLTSVSLLLIKLAYIELMSYL